MESFEWKDKFSVNVAEMDKHHKKMLGYFNELQSVVQSGSATQKTEEILKALTEYSRFHFTEEEKLMKAMSHPGLASQINQHAYFKKEVEEMSSQFTQGVLPSQSVLAFLRDWFINHILSEDFKYGVLLNQEKP